MEERAQYLGRKGITVAMRLQKERKDIVTFGRKLLSSGLTAGTGGNLSVINRKKNLIAITPSGVDYLEMSPEEVVLVGLGGGLIETSGYKPSSELLFHLALYAKRQDIQAIVHTHSVYATTLASLGWEIPPFHYLVAYSGKKVPLAGYATFGSEELARNVASAIGENNAVLMESHGVVAVGPNLAKAFETAEIIEYVARVYYLAKGRGEPALLSDEEMDRVIERFKGYGRK
ncbi:MAG: L-fuculose-phosphate aldolase [Deltaproteobacteria bacterium]